MGFFKKLFKEKTVKNIPDNACWGHLVSVHKVDVNTISSLLRCVTKKGVLNQEAVVYLRIFNQQEAEKRGVTITGWDTFDQYPDLIAFEGYVNDSANKADLKRKNF